MSLIRKVLQYEPVMSGAFFAALLAAVAEVLRAFDIYSLTQDQVTAVLAVFAVIVPLVGFVVRQQVTPTAKLRDREF